MSGLWVFVCGASGAGKDSVLAWATEQLRDNPRIVFARRMVTRPTHPGSDHDVVTHDQFAQLQLTDALAWHWQAHGFAYGIAAHYADCVQSGDVVVVNGSREHASALCDHSNVRVVEIVADMAEISRRLQNRGRDAPHEVAHRIARNAEFSALRSDCTIINAQSLAEAGQELVQYLQGLTVF